MRPWETEFVFVCEKETLKRKSRRFSYLRSERHLCMSVSHIQTDIREK